MKDLFKSLLFLLLIVLAWSAIFALGLFFNCLPAIVLGHILKG